MQTATMGITVPVAAARKRACLKRGKYNKCLKRAGGRR